MLQKALVFLLMILFGSTTLIAQVTEHPVSDAEYTPKIDGLLKNKVEFDMEHNKLRFEVRNARLGVKGKINPYISYRAEIDLSDEGKIRMLDAFVKITPLKNLDFYLGQRKVPFSSDYLRNPAETFFANRSFVAKYINDGLRDIGLVANYRFMFKVPFDVWIGALNGTGNNNPQWIDKPNYVGRLTVEPVKNFRLAGNLYQGSTLNEKNLSMYGGEIRYQTTKILIESEYIHRHYIDTIAATQNEYGFYLHSYYNFYTGAKMIQMISPVFRWDFMGTGESISGKTAERITTGVNFGFEPKQFKAEIRLNYEKYLKKYYVTHFDKFTIEFIAKF